MEREREREREKLSVKNAMQPTMAKQIELSENACWSRSTKLKEKKYNGINNNINTPNSSTSESAIANHSLSTGHDINRFVFELVHSVAKGRSMHRLEELPVLKSKSKNESHYLNDLCTFANRFIK